VLAFKGQEDWVVKESLKQDLYQHLLPQHLLPKAPSPLRSKSPPSPQPSHAETLHLKRTSQTTWQKSSGPVQTVSPPRMRDSRPKTSLNWQNSLLKKVVETCPQPEFTRLDKPQSVALSRTAVHRTIRNQYIIEANLKQGKGDVQPIVKEVKRVRKVESQKQLAGQSQDKRMVVYKVL